jgi:hypothetical protein
MEATAAKRAVQITAAGFLPAKPVANRFVAIAGTVLVANTDANPVLDVVTTGAIVAVELTKVLLASTLEYGGEERMADERLPAVDAAESEDKAAVADPLLEKNEATRDSTDVTERAVGEDSIGFVVEGGAVAECAGWVSTAIDVFTVGELPSAEIGQMVVYKQFSRL